MYISEGEIIEASRDIIGEAGPFIILFGIPIIISIIYYRNSKANEQTEEQAEEEPTEVAEKEAKAEAETEERKAEADAEADADEIEVVKSMVVQTGELHHHIDEKIGHDRCDVEKRESQFSISPVTEFKDLIQQTGGDGKKQNKPGTPCWQNDIGRDSEEVGKRHQEQSQEERKYKKQ